MIEVIRSIGSFFEFFDKIYIVIFVLGFIYQLFSFNVFL